MSIPDKNEKFTVTIKTPHGTLEKEVEEYQIFFILEAMDPYLKLQVTDDMTIADIMLMLSKEVKQ